MMPRGATYDTEREAVEIVLAEKVTKGWTPGPPLGQRA
jgi:hypothetical protein